MGDQNGRLEIEPANPNTMNIIRGFRRIGWVVTVPVAAFVVLVFFESTKEYSASNYEATLRCDECREDPGTFDLEKKKSVETREFHSLCFSEDVPLDIAKKVVADFVHNGTAKERVCAKNLREIHGVYDEGPENWQFTVYKRVNKLKLTGLVAAAIAISALVIQSLISVFAWIVRGFR